MSEIRVQRRRRQRAEARRSITAILEAAVPVLSARPDASVEDIAEAAGVTRQTVYAHYPSREALVSAAIDRVADAAIAAIEAADLDTGPASEALLRFIDAGWQTFLRYPLLLRLAPADPAAEQDRHRPVQAHLERLIARGQHTGEFTTRLPSGWLVTATIALGHAAGDQVTDEAMTADEATAALRHSLLRLFGGDGP